MTQTCLENSFNRVRLEATEVEEKEDMPKGLVPQGVTILGELY